MANLNVLISGASIAGPTVAYWLTRAGANVTVVERSPSLRRTGQGIDIRGAAREVVKNMDLWEAIQSRSTHEEGLLFVDENNGVIASFPADKEGGQTITSDVEILRGELAGLTYDKTLEMGMKYVFDDSVKTVKQDEGKKAKITFANGTPDGEYDLVVAADGLGSRLRNMAFGDYQPNFVKLNQYVAYYSIPRGETDTDWSRVYQATLGRTIVVRPDHLGNTQAFMIKSGKDQRMDDALDGDVSAQKQAFEEIFKDAGWEARRILDGMHATEGFYMQEGAQVKMDKWSKGRVTVVGDAGYAPSGATGMGTSMAFVGAYVLAGEVSKHADDIPTALAEYERIFRPYVDRAQKLPPGGPELANPQTYLGILAVRLGAKAASWISYLGISGSFMKLVALPAFSEDPFKLPCYEAFR